MNQPSDRPSAEDRAIRAYARRELRALRIRRLVRATALLLVVIVAAFALQETGVAPVVDGSVLTVQYVYTWFSELVRVVVLGGDPKAGKPASVILLQEESAGEAGDAQPDGSGGVIMAQPRGPESSTRDGEEAVGEPKPKARRRAPPPPPKPKPRGVG